MSLNRLDVEMLNHSLENLGDTFARNRQLNEQKRQAIEREMGDQVKEKASADRQSRGLDIEQKRLDTEVAASKAQSERFKIQEQRIGLQDAFKQLGDHKATLQKALSTLGEQVRSGGMDADTAAQYFQSGIDAIDDQDMRAKLLQDPTMQAAYDGSFDYSKFGSTAPSIEKTPGGQEYIVGKNGSITRGAAPPAPAKPPIGYTRSTVTPITDYQGNLTGQNKTNITTQTPLAPAAAPQPKPVTDSKGKTWLYKGNAADPTQDKNPSNWQAVK